jgi:hypothetical protein
LLTEFVQRCGLGLGLVREQFAADFKTGRAGLCRDFRPSGVAVAADRVRTECARHNNDRDDRTGPGIFDQISRITVFHSGICL